MSKKKQTEDDPKQVRDKHGKFVELANKRTSKARIAIRRLIPLVGINYESSLDERQQILIGIKEAYDELEKVFTQQRTTTIDDFQLK